MTPSFPTPEPLEAQHPDIYDRCIIQAVLCPTYVEGGEYCVTATVTLPDVTTRTTTVRYANCEHAERTAPGDVVYLAFPRH